MLTRLSSECKSEDIAHALIRHGPHYRLVWVDDNTATVCWALSSAPVVTVMVVVVVVVWVRVWVGECTDVCVWNIYVYWCSCVGDCKSLPCVCVCMCMCACMCVCVCVCWFLPTTRSQLVLLPSCSAFPFTACFSFVFPLGNHPPPTCSSSLRVGAT
jgi:hypothetical protein